MSGHADTIRRALPEREWEDEFTHDAHAALDALLYENQRLADRAVCSGCGSDVDEGGACHYEGCDDGQMIPASDLPGALREACDAQSEQWREHAEEVREMRAENQRLREALERIVETETAIRPPHPASIARVALREASAGDADDLPDVAWEGQ